MDDDWGYPHDLGNPHIDTSFFMNLIFILIHLSWYLYIWRVNENPKLVKFCEIREAIDVHV